ncbi:MAG: FHA domain-containing protein [Thermoanaerobaculia bacterium]|nr:FHA domain-containing protein [Thermoanaerobaculia bacterium]
MRVRFGEFVFDEERQELCRGAETIHLTPKAMELLAVLIERRPAVATKQELIDHLWPDVIVSPANLKNLVSELRNALDDHDRHGRFIRSVHGRGYAITDDAFEITESAERRLTPAVTLSHGANRFLLWPGENLVGRSAECNVSIDSGEISRHHARIVVTLEGVMIEDLQSKNGTFVNGSRIEKTSIEDGDQLGFGSVSLTPRISARDDTTRTSPQKRID